jgi:hypothetical protein
MARRYRLAVAVTALLSVLVVGTAVAATRALSPNEAGQTVIDDAARQLGVEPKALSEALEQALKNRVDEAIRDGRLGRREAARLKERVDAGEALLFGLGAAPRFHHEHLGDGPLPAKSDAAARYLGMTQAELRRALEGGKTLAQVARDRNKSVEGLVDALVAPAEQKLARAVKDGQLSEGEKREILSRLREHLADVVNGRFTPRFHHGPGKPELRDVRRAIF